MPAASFLLQFEEDLPTDPDFLPNAGTQTGTRVREESDQDQAAILLGTRTLVKGNEGTDRSYEGYLAIPR